MLFVQMSRCGFVCDGCRPKPAAEVAAEASKPTRKFAAVDVDFVPRVEHRIVLT
jgi:hypothetical protein